MKTKKPLSNAKRLIVRVEDGNALHLIKTLLQAFTDHLNHYF